MVGVRAWYLRSYGKVALDNNTYQEKALMANRTVEHTRSPPKGCEFGGCLVASRDKGKAIAASHARCRESGMSSWSSLLLRVLHKRLSNCNTCTDRGRRVSDCTRIAKLKLR